ncbi:hypothetical protein ISF_08061 [Cordyceps fumosorosea ARSEF 2679]|uniref:PD-(D/E)XK nuclease-like domain-containing protein n=1 Tax=Cordyceps fumosorosea (strain ARSEF 2679) TaxID=1081104 RepID=A0A162MER4_CORFA|nr:hypothetical protein ISF_08061 [Cordyceps fumosorosea ARSEF 2679]OAA55140.1 hypothetical protein ISF_08061 [Cordyceps fumosorosea ARSEF 2679]
MARSEEEGKLQLAIWTSAWHRRMLSIMSKFEQGGDDDSQNLWAPKPRKVEAKIITLPLMLTLCQDWKLLFACDRGGEGLEILGDFSIGETSSLLGLYTIVAVLQELADWVEVTFRKWIMDVFMINPDDDDKDDSTGVGDDPDDDQNEGGSGSE